MEWDSNRKRHWNQSDAVVLLSIGNNDLPEEHNQNAQKKDEGTVFFFHRGDDQRVAAENLIPSDGQDSNEFSPNWTSDRQRLITKLNQSGVRTWYVCLRLFVLYWKKLITMRMIRTETLRRFSLRVFRCETSSWLLLNACWYVGGRSL